MHTHRPHPDYLPAAGHDILLPAYDLMSRILGAGKLHRALVEQADLQPGQRVLEIGCGTGNLSALIAGTVDLTATDPDPKALARARRKVPQATFDRAYVQELPYADASFDRVLSSLMLHHLDRATKTAGLAEVHRVLEPGGTVHIVDITGHGAIANGARPHFDGNLVDLLTDAGFDAHEVASERRLHLGQVSYLVGRK